MKNKRGRSPRILAICCSPRENGVNASLAKDFKKKSPLDSVTIIMLSQKNISPCDSCGYCVTSKLCHYNDDFNDIVENINLHEAIIFFCPVYKGSVPSKVRAFIERTTILYGSTSIYEQKIIGIVVTGKVEGVGKLTVADDLMHFATSLGFIIVPPIIFGHVLPDGELMRYDEIIASLSHLVERIKFWAK
ncbi:MAG: flavodoxin family protein [Deltaproteobacteria bacterium]|nr:flavodoxin family protein [Deltaproteobacteria bacterium]